MYKPTSIDFNQRSQRGFTMIELLIVVAIVALLAAIAVPSYSSYIQQSRRQDAQHLLMLNAHRLQRCFTLEGVYNGSCVTRTDSNDGYYTLLTDLGTNTYVLSARPVPGSSQADDEDCLTLTYSHTGLQSATGPLGKGCW